MLKRFTSEYEALEYGANFSRQYNCETAVANVYRIVGDDHVYFCAAPSSFHLLPFIIGKYTPKYGWHFTGLGEMEDTENSKKLLNTPNRDPLPGEGERLYGIATKECTLKQLITINTNIEKYNSCVWHEVAKLYSCSSNCCSVLTTKGKTMKVTLNVNKAIELLQQVQAVIGNISD